jgi:hypothetical protein
MNVTHKKVYTIYKVLYKIKQVSHIILKKLSLKIVNKSHSSRLVMQTVTVEMVSGYCVPSYIGDKLCIASIVSGILRY